MKKPPIDSAPLTIGRRIVLGSIIMFLVLLAIGFMSIAGFRHIKNDVSELKYHYLPSIAEIGRVNGHFLTCYSRLLLAKGAANLEDRKALIAQADASLELAKKGIALYEAKITDGEDRKLFDAFYERLVAYLGKRVVYVQLLMDGRLDEAVAFMNAQMEPANAGLRDQLVALSDWNLNSGSEFTKNTVALVDTKLRDLGFVLLAGLVFSCGVGFVVVRGVKRSLTAMSQVLAETTDNLLDSAHQVSASSQALAEGASEQAASLEEISSSMEELSSMTKRNSDNAQAGKAASNQARTAAEAGAAEMEKMQGAMSAIQQSSSDISKIIKTIDEIAFQTNILALNAAVEAARAGEAGAGFAVVADEVRSLAQRSAIAAKETANKIEDASLRSAQGVEFSNRVAFGLQQILEKNREVDQLVTEVAAASQEQSEGIAQINTAVSQMDKVTQANAAGAEETAAAAEELNAQSAELSNASVQLAALAGTKVKASNPAPSRVSRDDSAQAEAVSVAAYPLNHQPAPGRKNKDRVALQDKQAPSLSFRD